MSGHQTAVACYDNGQSQYFTIITIRFAYINLVCVFYAI